MWIKQKIKLYFGFSTVIYFEGSLQDWYDNNLSSFKGSVIVCPFNQSLLIRVQKKHVIHSDLHFQRFWTIICHTDSFFVHWHAVYTISVSQDCNVTAPGHFRGRLIRGQGNFVGLFNLILFMGQLKNYMYPTPFKKYKLSISNIIISYSISRYVYKLDLKNMSYQWYINRYLFLKKC